MFAFWSSLFLLRLIGLFPGERVRQRSDLKPWRVAFWASLLMRPHDLFPGKRVCQNSYPKPWCFASWALLLLPPHILFLVERVRQRSILGSASVASPRSVSGRESAASAAI